MYFTYIEKRNKWKYNCTNLKQINKKWSGFVSPFGLIFSNKTHAIFPQILQFKIDYLSKVIKNIVF